MLAGTTEAMARRLFAVGAKVEAVVVVRTKVGGGKRGTDWGAVGGGWIARL